MLIFLQRLGQEDGRGGREGAARHDRGEGGDPHHPLLFPLHPLLGKQVKAY